MNPIDRRHLMRRAAGFAGLAGLAAVSLGSAVPSWAASGPKVAETDPVAAGLGYREDSSRADQKKYPKHTASQNCANCQLFQGPVVDGAGGCPLFAGKQVAAKGWCSAWAQKAA